MRNFIKYCILAAVPIISLGSCDRQHPDGHTIETPKALEDKTSSYNLVSKRGYDDLVESIYADVLEGDKALQDLERDIELLQTSKNDSTSPFYNYDVKNVNYYNSARFHIRNMKDTVLRQRLEQLIGQSAKRYEAFVARHQALMTGITARDVSIYDMHKAIKVLRTMPLIEVYQKSHLPPIEPLQGFYEKQEKVQRTENAMLKQ